MLRINNLFIDELLNLNLAMVLVLTLVHLKEIIAQFIHEINVTIRNNTETWVIKLLSIQLDNLEELCH